MPEDKAWRQLGKYMGLGFLLPCAAFVGLAIGYGLDHALHTGKVFELIFLCLGLAAGFLQIYRAAVGK
ncbi:MAG TPA: AtpZ/AtpI family protein [Terriglobales bacterium]|nr:AtpZ/AtpI family protein [Terriglobales bacterium]